MSQTPCTKTRNFLLSATPNQFDWILSQYDECLRLKANSKSQKPENIIKLDKWYQNDLPKKLKSRGKEAHLTHEELVQTIKWKLARGKFRPNLTNLVQMNTPRVAMQETKKAFRKIAKTEDVQGAVQALSNLKGVGPAMASAILAAGAPHIAPYMADEVLLALPETDGLDYTMKEYMRLVDHINEAVERLNAQGGDFTPHKVELAVWAYFIANDLKPDLLEDMPSAAKAAAPAAVEEEPTNGDKAEEEQTPANNGNGVNGQTIDEDSMSSAQDEESRSSMNNGSVEEEAPKPASEEEEPAKMEEQEESNGKPTNGTSDEASKESNGNGVAAPIPSKPVDEPVAQEEDTSDSTKENVEATSSPSLKRPAENNSSEDANDATPAGESEVAAAAADVDEPSAKKLKPEEAAPAPLTA